MSGESRVDAARIEAVARRVDLLKRASDWGGVDVAALEPRDRALVDVLGRLVNLALLSLPGTTNDTLVQYLGGKDRAPAALMIIDDMAAGMVAAAADLLAVHDPDGLLALLHALPTDQTDLQEEIRRRYGVPLPHDSAFGRDAVRRAGRAWADDALETWEAIEDALEDPGVVFGEASA